MKNKILKGITCFAFIVAIVCMASADSKNILIPAIGLLLSSGWLAMFSYANR